MKPNLFKYGTGELTHDAILSWILAWGNHKENKLYNLASKFVELLTDEEIRIEDIEVLRQYKHIDVLVKLNEDKIIVIEDKIDTGEHSNQLAEYKKTAKENFKDKKIYYAYVTVGDECDYDHILEKGYRVIERKDLINIIKDFLGINDILDDYYNYLYEIEEDYNSFKHNDLNKWTTRGWQGFYKELNKRFPKAGWGNVNNPRGRFVAFYWDFYELRYKDKVDYNIYLQMEHYPLTKQNRIAFKVSVTNDDYKSEIRNYVWKTLKLIIDDDEIIKKTNFAKGTSMTFAQIENYSTKDELYSSIKLVEGIHRKLKETLYKEMVGISELIGLEDGSYFGEDICIIDGIIPNEKINNNILLITNVKNNEIRELLKLNDIKKVFVFDDRPSLDNFKECLSDSKRYLDEGFNAHELISFYNSDFNSIKTLKYIKGIENVKETKGAILFIDEDDVNSIKDYSLSDGFYPYIIRDEESSKGLEGYYIIDNKNMI